jgi:hypothetical protein
MVPAEPVLAELVLAGLVLADPFAAVPAGPFLPLAWFFLVPLTSSLSQFHANLPNACSAGGRLPCGTAIEPVLLYRQ